MDGLIIKCDFKRRSIKARANTFACDWRALNHIRVHMQMHHALRIHFTYLYLHQRVPDAHNLFK